MTIPSIPTPRTLMRPLAQQDVDGLSLIFSKPHVMRYMPGGRPRSRAEAERAVSDSLAHWRKHGFGWWAVVSRSDDRLMGWCGLSSLEGSGEVELLYMLDDVYWGAGHATETARAALDFGFSVLRLPRICALAVPGNVASMRVMERLGMTCTGLARHYGSDLMKFVAEPRNAGSSAAR